ncbi:MAG: FAS1-like dehydratase domain-containing protein, partial [Mycobacteriaceae bacterium]
EINPLYMDSDYAQRFGHTDLPVPPTFLFSIELEGPDPFKWVAELGVDLRHILHGEQSFVYHSVAHAGDTLVAAPYISDVYEKGSLGFLVKETKVARENGSEVADLRTVIVVRGGEGK